MYEATRRALNVDGLIVREVSKRFGAIQANNKVSLSVKPGSLHAILGENGAGKSTLMKILSGFQAPDSGFVSLGGTPVELGSSKMAISAGIGMLHQDPLVVLPFTVLENFMLGTEFTQSQSARRTLVEYSNRLGFDLDPDRITKSLGVGERQQLELVRLLAQGVRVLILDEPTSGITAEQRDSLFSALKGLAEKGLIVLFVSHKLEEIQDLCETVTVMRHGKVAATRGLPADPDELVELMFGDTMEPRLRLDYPIGEPVLTVRGLTARDGRASISEIELEAREGEIIGLAGLEGSGQRVFLRSLAGLVKAPEGIIQLGESNLAELGHRRRILEGVHLVPAGRLEEGLFPGLTIAEHIALATGQPVSQESAQEAITRFRIKGLPGSYVDSLSGGNQQRLLLSMMPDRIRLLLLEHPTRGLDVESAGLVWETILERRSHGTVVIFASSDLDELVRYADRIAVFFDGKILDVIESDSTGTNRLGHLIGGSR